MYDKTSLKILEQVYLKPSIHKRELSKQLKLGMPSIDFAIRKISKLLKQKRSGNQINYYLNYSNKDLTSALYAVESSRLNRLPSKVIIAINDFLYELLEKPILVIIFGSYAKGNYMKSSDIDILLVFQKVEDTNKIENLANKISMRTNTHLNPIYLDYTSFKVSFHNSTKEFFKNLNENKLILTGIEWWRQLKYEEA